jgi:cell pole-organizing protein PopZ
LSALEETLAEVAAEVGATSDAGEFKRDDRLFAAARSDAAEFRLDAEIADAALGTPSTSASTRGPGWVRLTVDESNPQDLDRAKAWFLSAFRYAERAR